MEQLLLDIERFCDRHGMAVTAFGAQAMNDKAFVIQLRQGRRVWPTTEEKVRAFMRRHGVEQGHADGPTAGAPAPSPRNGRDFTPEGVMA